MAQHSKNMWSGIGYVNNRLEASHGIMQYIGSLANVQCSLYVLASMLLSQAMLPGGAMPFCVPLAAALLLLQKPVLPVVLGCALGLLVRWQPITWVNGWQLGACAILMITLRGGWDWKPWKVSLAAAAAMLLPLPFLTRRVDMIIVVLSGSVTAGLLTPVYLRVLLVANMPRQSPLSNDDKLCCLLFLAVLSLGGSWLGVDMLSLGVALTGLTVFLIAWSAGPGLALPAGVIMGLAQMIAGGTIELVLLLAVLGALAGMLRGGLRFMPLAGGVLACGLVGFALGGMDLVLATLPSLAAGGLAFMAVPRHWLDYLHGLLESEAQPVFEPDSAAASYILSGYSEAMAGMARVLPIPEKVTETQPVELLACRLCSGCERKQSCWDEGRESTMELMEGVLDACSGDTNAMEIEQVARMNGCLRAGEMYTLAMGILSSRQQKDKEDARRIEARGWALEQLRGQARAIASLSERLGEDCTQAMQARAAICSAMPALRGRADALTVCTIEDRLNVWLDVSLGEGQVERLESALGAALGRRMELLDVQTQHNVLHFVEKPRLRLAVGRSAMPIAGEDISGDSTLSERLDAGRHILAISDGMGSGRAARNESRVALDLLLQALRAGYSRVDALRTVNGLLVACRGDEMYATMDLCVLDLDSGEVTLDKLGACPSFLLRAGKCKRIGGDSLPMGILDAVRPRALTTRMQLGDMLLMVSDGVMDAFGGEEDSFIHALGGLVSGERMPSPQRFAETLLRRAYERCGGTALDDMTVVVAKLEEAA